MIKSIGCAALLAASTLSFAAVDNMKLPEPVRVPAGHMQTLETIGTGEITYECREKKDMAGAYEWAFVAPVATLWDMQQKTIGKYYGGPTWEANDGSKVTGKQVAIAPAPAGNISLQLVKADPAMGNGAMTGVTFIQRLETKGGVAPAMACGSTNAGAKQQVWYQAKYVFYKQG